MVEKKVTAKETEKLSVMRVVTDALKAANYDFEDGVLFGTTSGTIIVHGKSADVKLKPITPKSGVDRYTKTE